ncbi:MAG: right-handed parallel beta-helix repeat-containing protein, partial [Thermoplasmata archaeon]
MNHFEESELIASGATTLYVGPSETYKTITAAIIAANPGDTIFVYNGTYNENIVINKTLSLIGESNTNTTILATVKTTPIITVEANHVNITRFNTTNEIFEIDAMIKVINYHNITIKDCRYIITDWWEWCKKGIYLKNSNHSKIINTTIDTTTENGILVENSSNVLIENNTIGYFGHGIEVVKSSHSCIIINNTCFENSRGMIVESNKLYPSNKIINNTVYKNDYGIMATGWTIVQNNICYSNEYAGIYYKYVNNYTFSNNTCYDNGEGFDHWEVSYCIFENLTSFNNTFGLHAGVMNNHHNIIRNNNFSNNYYGMLLYNTEHYIIENNTIHNSNFDIGYGIRFERNSNYGKPMNNTIKYNEILNGKGGGIYIDEGDKNRIFHNKIINNSNIAFNLSTNCNNNLIYFNELRNNNIGGVQSYDYGLNNQWNRDFRGNYWSDYESRYPDAINLGFFWDTPYDNNGTSSSKDYYPLSYHYLNFTVREPIRINSDSEFIASNGVSSGTGTYEDPYIIDNNVISGADSGSCLYIGNTTKHFIVRNNTLFYASGNDGLYYRDAGAVLYNVFSGTIENNTCVFNEDKTSGGGTGIFIDTTKNVTIKDNFCIENKNSGIKLLNSTLIDVENNTCRRNKIGISLNNSFDNFIKNNNCSDSLNGTGFHLMKSNDNIITNNDCYKNKDNGFYLEKSDKNLIENNSYLESDFGLVLDLSFNNTIQNITIIDTLIGLRSFYSNNNKIQNNIIQSANHSIIFEYSNTNSIKNNTFSFNINGTYLENSDKNSFYNNDFKSEGNGYGLNLKVSDNNLFCNNTINNSRYGIYLNYSTNNIFYSTEMINCSLLIDKNIDFETATTQVIPSNNTIDGKPLYYYKNVNMNNASVPNDAAQIILANVTLVKIENLTLNRRTPSIVITFSSRNEVSNNNLTSNELNGILILRSNHNVIKNNTFNYTHLYNSNNNIIINNSFDDSQMHDSNYCVFINSTFNNALLYNSNFCVIENSTLNDLQFYNSNYCELENNTLNNLQFDNSNYCAIKNSTFNESRLYYSNNCRFKYNTYRFCRLYHSDKAIFYNNSASNSICGLELYNSNYAEIRFNKFSSHDFFGIYLRGSFGSSYNEIEHNIFLNNKEEAIKILMGSRGNQISGNHFLFNNVGESVQVSDSGYNNHWNDTSGYGNFWSDYQDSYPDSVLKGDVWDTPYLINSFNNAMDYYPLAHLDHKPIRINSDEDFTFENGVFYGTGTEQDPYIITSLAINGSAKGHGIFIGNTTKHFIITYCKLYDSSSNGDEYNRNSGLILYNVTNATITDIELASNKGSGIYINNSRNFTIEGCRLHNNSIGIDLDSTIDTIDIISTSIKDSKSFDLQLDNDSHARILDCSLNFTNINYRDLTSNITVQWYLNIKTVNHFGVAVPGVEVIILDNKSNIMFNNQSGASGWCANIIFNEYTESQGNKIIYTPHNITASKKPFVTYNNELEFHNNTDLIITLHRRAIIVDWQGQGDYLTITEGLNNAIDDDLIFVWEGTYNENIIIDDNVDIIGNGSGKTIISGDNTDNVVDINSAAVYMTGFTVRDSKRGSLDHAGIKIESVAMKCRIENNTLTQNSFGMYIEAGAYGKIINNNTINFNDMHGIYTRCDKSVITNNTIHNNSYGIHLFLADDYRIESNTIITNSGNGIYLGSSHRNKIIHNNVTSNGGTGIKLYYSNDNRIDNIDIILNKEDGILLDNSDRNTIINTNVSFNSWAGINLYKADYCRIENTDIISNKEYGIYLDESAVNGIIDNDVTSSNWDGICLDTSSKNNIIDNRIKN